MANNIYVGGFPYRTTREDLARLFASCGTVLSSKVIMDRATGKPKGFGFVEMSTDAEAAAAVAKLNGSMVGDRKIFVVSGRPQKGGAPKRGSAAKPAASKPVFVERRSGKDRRQSPGGAPAGDRRDASAAPAPSAPTEKKWEKRPFDPTKKPWAKKPFDASKKPWEKKPFDKKKPWTKMKP